MLCIQIHATHCQRIIIDCSMDGIDELNVLNELKKKMCSILYNIPYNAGKCSAAAVIFLLQHLLPLNIGLRRQIERAA